MEKPRAWFHWSFLLSVNLAALYLITHVLFVLCGFLSTAGQHVSESLDQEDASIIWNTLPVAIYVRFDTAATWAIDGLQETNVYPVAPQRKQWHLDKHRQRPVLRVTRKQYPLAPAFAVTAKTKLDGWGGRHWLGWRNGSGQHRGPPATPKARHSRQRRRWARMRNGRTPAGFRPNGLPLGRQSAVWHLRTR